MLDPDDWQARAACRDTPTSAFYPERSNMPAETVAAMRVCVEACPVRYQCLDSAMPDEFGVWGGWSGQVRLTARRRGFDCPWCGAPIGGTGEMEAADRLFGPPPSVFCGPSCLDAAVSADWEGKELVDKRLAELAVWAAKVDKDRRRPKALPEFEQLDLVSFLESA